MRAGLGVGVGGGLRAGTGLAGGGADLVTGAGSGAATRGGAGIGAGGAAAERGGAGTGRAAIGSRESARQVVWLSRMNASIRGSASPIVKKGATAGVSAGTARSARPSSVSSAMISANTYSSSGSRTRIGLVPSTTASLVRIRPLGATTTPEPVRVPRSTPTSHAAGSLAGASSMRGSGGAADCTLSTGGVGVGSGGAATGAGSGVAGAGVSAINASSAMGAGDGSERVGTSVPIASVPTVPHAAVARISRPRAALPCCARDATLKCAPRRRRRYHRLARPGQMPEITRRLRLVQELHCMR